MKTFLELISGLDSNSGDGYLIDLIQLVAKQVHFPPKIVRKGISQGKLKINDRTVKVHEFPYSYDMKVMWSGTVIEVPVPPASNNFDLFLHNLFEQFGIHQPDRLYDNQKVIFFAYVIEYFRSFGYNVSELARSGHNEAVMIALEEFCKRYYPDLKNLKKKALVEQLIAKRDATCADFQKKVSAVLNNLYDKPEILLNEFRHLFSGKHFKHLIAPLQGTEVPYMAILERCVRALNQLQNAAPGEKYQKRTEAQEAYQEILQNYFYGKDDSISIGFARMVAFFKEKVDWLIGYTESGTPVLKITPEDRTYNFSLLRIVITAILENTGTGIAKHVQIQIEQPSNIVVSQDLVDILPPNESRKVKFELPAKPFQNTAHLKFLLRWENDFKESKMAVIEDFEIKGQEQDLPWDDLRRTNPYGIRIVDDPNRLYGRDQLIEDLKWNVESNNFITSFVLYGQKRVGKSSIVRSLETVYKDNPNILFIYKAMGDLKDPDALRTFHRIGESFSGKLLNLYKTKVSYEDQTFDHIKRSLNGSINALIETIDFLHDLHPSLRFIFVLDEFDELNREFFENGEIGKTFALNIGKGLNERSYVGMILVGSENMVSKTKQGMRLNSFEIKKVDTFDKSNEFDAYCRIITEPSRSCLTFSAETLDLLFNYTNGNPYFTNVLVGKIFQDAYEKRTAFIDSQFAQEVVTRQITLMSNKDFQHFWDDGISEEAVNYEKVLDRRRRVLTAFAEAKNSLGAIDLHALKRKVRYPKRYEISEHQIEETINEYIQRDILRESRNRELSLVPMLFEEWLLGKGYYQVVAQLEDKDEILDKVLQESKLHVSDSELSEILITLDEDPRNIRQLRTFLDQFDSNHQKRIIADLLRKTVTISTTELRDHLTKVKRSIWGDTIELAEGQRDIRTDAEIVCFNESFTQNAILADLLKTTFKFSASKSVKRISDLPKLASNVKHLLIFEPVVDCPYYYRNMMSILLKGVHPVLLQDIRVHLICFLITDECKVEVDDLASSNFGIALNTCTIRVCQRSDISPFLNAEESINDNTWKLLTSLDPAIDESSCLVKISQLIPFQTIPLFWSNSSRTKPLMSTNPSPRKVYDSRMQMSKLLRTLRFSSESDVLELKASMLRPGRNWKGIQGLAQGLRHIKDDIVKRQKLDELDKLWSFRLTQQERKNAAAIVKHSIAKTLAGFANTKGGTLYIGIEDDFTVQGAIYDREHCKDEEDFRKEFDNLTTQYLGAEAAQLFKVDIIQLPNTVPLIKISVTASTTEIAVKCNDKGQALARGKEEIYVRRQQETALLSAKEYYDWRTVKDGQVRKTHF